MQFVDSFIFEIKLYYIIKYLRKYVSYILYIQRFLFLDANILDFFIIHHCAI